MEQIEAELRTRWQNLWQANGIADNHFDHLASLYSDSRRKYHTLNHIKSCFDEFDTVKPLANNPTAIEFAIWFHDAIYDTSLVNNEEESARLAREILTQEQLPQDLIETVNRLILLTKTHKPSNDIDEQIVSDIDLSILGSGSRDYIYYKEAIRREYSFIPLYKFRKGRISVMQKFWERLEKDQLFYLPYFKAKNENASQNLSNELMELKSMKVAVYAGSFDPPTNGHLYVINKADNLFDNLIVAIGQNPDKKGGRFPIEERLGMLREITLGMPKVDVTSYPSCYLINFASSIDAGYIVRGLRNERDWQAESDLDEFNFGVNPDITTVFLRTPDSLGRISSSFVMGLIGYEGWEESVKSRVPESVFRRIKSLRSLVK